jgi:hypothetical protein
MRPAPTAPRGREVRDAAIDSPLFALSTLVRPMRWPGPEQEEDQHSLHITLREGFRGHTVVIVVDADEVFRRSDVTSGPAMARIETVEIVVQHRLVEMMVSVTPGDYVASLDLDVAAYPHLAISLVGEGTVSVETSAHPLP